VPAFKAAGLEHRPIYDMRHTLALVAEGRTLREAGDAVGAWPSSVANWLAKAA
jgi:hypothetical protein